MVRCCGPRLSASTAHKDWEVPVSFGRSLQDSVLWIGELARASESAHFREQ